MYHHQTVRGHGHCFPKLNFGSHISLSHGDDDCENYTVLIVNNCDFKTVMCRLVVQEYVLRIFVELGLLPDRLAATAVQVELILPGLEY